MNERKKQLIETMKKLNKTMGEEYLTFAEEMAKPEVLNTGIVEVDKLIGGLRCGHTTVIYGANSSGKSTLVYQTIANLQKQNKICALIDMEHSFEPERATQLGIDLKELILVQTCTNAEQAMDIIITLCKEKAVDFIALDSIHALSPKQEQETKKGVVKSMEDDSMALLARKLSQFFRTVGGHLFNAKIPLLLIGQCRISGIGTFIVKAGLGAGEAIKFYMYTCVFMRRGQGSDAPMEKIKREVVTPDGDTLMKTFNEPMGFDAVLKLEKSKSSNSAKENTDIHIPFYYETGFLPKLLQQKADEEQKEINEECVKEELPDFEDGALEIPKETNVSPKKRGRKKKLDNIETNKLDITKNPGQNEREIEDVVDNLKVTDLKKKSRGRPKKNA